MWFTSILLPTMTFARHQDFLSLGWEHQCVQPRGKIPISPLWVQRWIQTESPLCPLLILGPSYSLCTCNLVVRDTMLVSLKSYLGNQKVSFFWFRLTINVLREDRLVFPTEQQQSWTVLSKCSCPNPQHVGQKLINHQIRWFPKTSQSCLFQKRAIVSQLLTMM